MADFRAQYNEMAQKNVKSQLIISEIIKLENIEATEEEVDAKVAEQAKSVEKETEEYKKNMDPRQFDYIRNDIIITKLFDMLRANNEMVAEVEETAEKVEKAPAKKTTTKKTSTSTAKKTTSTAKKTTAKKTED